MQLVPSGSPSAARKPYPLTIIRVQGPAGHVMILGMQVGHGHGVHKVWPLVTLDVVLPLLLKLLDEPLDLVSSHLDAVAAEGLWAGGAVKVFKGVLDVVLAKRYPITDCKSLSSPCWCMATMQQAVLADDITCTCDAMLDVVDVCAQYALTFNLLSFFQWHSVHSQETSQGRHGAVAMMMGARLYAHGAMAMHCRCFSCHMLFNFGVHASELYISRHTRAISLDVRMPSLSVSYSSKMCIRTSPPWLGEGILLRLSHNAAANSCNPGTRMLTGFASSKAWWKALLKTSTSSSCPVIFIRHNT